MVIQHGDQRVRAIGGIMTRYIRLIESRRTPTRQMAGEGIEWGYACIGGAIVGLLIVLAPLVRAWASVNW